MGEPVVNEQAFRCNPRWKTGAFCGKFNAPSHAPNRLPRTRSNASSPNSSGCPGIGPRSAERIALWLVGNGRQESSRGREVARDDAGKRRPKVRPCVDCGFFTTEETLRNLPRRSPRRRAALRRRTGDGHPAAGAYRCLQRPLPRARRTAGSTRPRRPGRLTIERLFERVRDGHATEIILALGADVEGEATAQYLAGLLKDFPEVSVTRIAQGLPAGGGLESADELTLSRAMTGRVLLSK